MKYHKNVFRTLALITQVGISMLVPIFLMVFLGRWLDHKFGTGLFLPFLIIGIAAGFRNVYHLTIHANDDEENK